MGTVYCKGSDIPSQKLNNQFKISEKLSKQLKNVKFENKSSQHKKKIRTDEEILAVYKIQMRVGKGLFSKVYFAIDPSGIKVALKVISKKNFLEETLIEKILMEKELLIQMNHPNILKLFRTLQTNSSIYIVLEYCDKGTLADLFKTDITYSIDTYRIITAQIIEALSYLHMNGVIYGDLKAENVLINHNGVLKLGDFNLSATSSLLDNRIRGTISYIAPELLMHNHKSEKSDYWSLGVLLYYLYYRQFPFKTNTQSEMLFNIYSRSIPDEPRDRKAPKEFRNFIMGLLVKDPAKRLGSNIMEIKKHPFFKNFDWKTFQENKYNFDYADTLPSLCSGDDTSRSMNNDTIQRSFVENQSDFYYNIENFTFENDVDFSKLKTSFLKKSREEKYF